MKLEACVVEDHDLNGWILSASTTASALASIDSREGRTPVIVLGLDKETGVRRRSTSLSPLSLALSIPESFICGPELKTSGGM